MKGDEAMFVISEELKKLPSSPGVYIMHDIKDNIIYIGKAVSLKNRVRQYFQEGNKKTEKIKQMVKKIHYFEYIVTDSELEALILECNLIKEHMPKYNTMLKDDKTYPYLKITVYEEYPRILFAREMKKDKARYFGPYTNAKAVKDIIDLLIKIYKIRTCNRNLPRDMFKLRPCLNYHIGQCDAPCMGFISSEDYRKSIEQAEKFLEGNYSDIEKILEKKMYEASEKMEFEEAASIRDMLNGVKTIAQKQKITSEDVMDRDIIAYATENDDAVVQVFFMRDGKILGREHFHVKVPADGEEDILSSFIKQYYSGTPFIPKEIMVSKELEDANLLEEYLAIKKGRKVKISNPKKSDKAKLVELARKNAKLVLDMDMEKIKRDEVRTKGAVSKIFESLGINDSDKYRIEAFDISNISGFQSVGSMVVFEEGKPKKNDYRKFKIKTITGPDDYGSMKEVLERRLSHKEDDKFSRFPDLIMMDGGKGQINAAKEVLDKLGIIIPVCGMVKDDNHNTRGLLFENNEIPLDTKSEAFMLITRIQDEAHRFAIEYHRSLRGKNQVHSVLDDIENVGPKRRIALMKYFRGIEDIKKAEVEELLEVPHMNRISAESVYKFFRKK
jgi:excinuclease ABC subunit C